jgi:G3E family GTPase
MSKAKSHLDIFYKKQVCNIYQHRHMIPITILTGFLGAGKTTLVNQIVKQNPSIKFGFIINEFGEVGIDGQLIESSGEELVEISNGCLCCVVRKDLQDTVLKVAESGRVDYIIIEASGLAEPMPLSQTFATDNLSSKVNLDAIICVVDPEHFLNIQDNYAVALEQLESADIIVLNKTNDLEEQKLNTILTLIQKLNPSAAVLKNENLDTSTLIETGKWSEPELTTGEMSEHKHMHSEHHTEDHAEDHSGHKHHEHESVDEVIFVTQKPLDPPKLDFWLQNHYPVQAVRAKGFVRLSLPENKIGLFLFQLVGAKKSIQPFEPYRADFDYDNSRIVLIGKGLDKEKILEALNQVTV